MLSIIFKCFSLHGIIKDLRAQLQSPKPKLPQWLFVTPDSIPAIMRSLNYWASISKSTKRMLADHQHGDAPSRGDGKLSFANAQGQQRLEEADAFETEAVKHFLNSKSPAELADIKWVPAGLSPAQARAYVDRNMDRLVEEIREELFSPSRKGTKQGKEERWYQEVKVFLPPRQLWGRHTEFDKGWEHVCRTQTIPDHIRRRVGPLLHPLFLASTDYPTDHCPH